jgi:hypothetical protein
LLDFKNGNINRKDKTAKRKEKGKKAYLLGWAAAH